MDGMLSQDEINALLNGMDLSADEEPDKIGSSEEVTEVPSSTPSETGDEQGASTEALLTDVEKDAIGEVANISMGSSATTLYSLVNRKVNITTPVVQIEPGIICWRSMKDPVYLSRLSIQKGWMARIYWC